MTFIVFLLLSPRQAHKARPREADCAHAGVTEQVMNPRCGQRFGRRVVLGGIADSRSLAVADRTPRGGEDSFLVLDDGQLEPTNLHYTWKS